MGDVIWSISSRMITNFMSELIGVGVGAGLLDPCRMTALGTPLSHLQGIFNRCVAGFNSHHLSVVTRWTPLF